VNKNLALLLILFVQPVFADAILIQEVSNLGAQRTTVLERKEHALFYDGARIDPSLAAMAGPAYQVILPRTDKIKRTNARCYAGQYTISKSRKIERGCLEDPRMIEIQKALTHLKKLAMLSGTAK
jgi:hypothetical protein